MSWPILKKHHGHASLVFGCAQCIGLLNGWTCTCGCPNAGSAPNCASCGNDKAVTRQRCICEHARGKHAKMSDACSSTAGGATCTCSKFETASEVRERANKERRK
jgi:hypothetical protein